MNEEDAKLFRTDKPISRNLVKVKAIVYIILGFPFTISAKGLEGKPMLTDNGMVEND